MPSRTRRLLPLVLATTATQASIVVPAPLLVEIARDIGGSVSAVGAARSVLAGTAVAVSLPIGPLIDRIGVRPLIEARYVFLCCRHRRPGDGRRGRYRLAGRFGVHRAPEDEDPSMGR